MDVLSANSRTSARIDGRRDSLSVVVPLYNEEAVLPDFHRRLAAVLDAIDADAEIIYVNDGSRDRTMALLTEMHDRDARVAVIELSRNFGKEVAMSAGLDAARGDAVVVIDADLQDPPELIPEMLRQVARRQRRRADAPQEPRAGVLAQDGHGECVLPRDGEHRHRSTSPRTSATSGCSRAAPPRRCASFPSARAS